MFLAKYSTYWSDHSLLGFSATFSLYGMPYVTKINLLCQLDCFPISWTPARFMGSKYDPENTYSHSGERSRESRWTSASNEIFGNPNENKCPALN